MHWAGRPRPYRGMGNPLRGEFYWGGDPYWAGRPLLGGETPPLQGHGTGDWMSHQHRKRQRRSIRLPIYDYASPGAYFITVCVWKGECMLGEVVDGDMRLNELGHLAHDFWMDVSAHFPSVSIDAFTIMPNHLHAIVVIQTPSTVVGDAEEGEEDARRGAVAAPLAVPPPAAGPGPIAQSQIEKPTLGQIVGYYKYQTTKQINRLRDMPGVPFWQRNYWEHVVRNEESLNRIREYIENNPARWSEDQLHPDAPPNPFKQWPLG
jgi:putative transposase